jgi:predicted DNA-binding antitoxin AbrB/MazE fold protein
MTMVVKAIYEGGKLRLLEPIQLAEGQAVTLDILPENANESEAIRAALGDSVRWHDPTDNRHAWVEEKRDEIAEAFKGLKSLSEIIIEERDEQI